MFQVLFERKQTNLHAFWDTKLVQLLGPDIERVAVEINSRRASPSVDVVAVDAWAQECHQVAIDVAYDHVRKGSPPVPLDAAYVSAALGTARSQLQKAGLRLALVLNQLFR
jgi:hypothetical protein